MTESPDSSATGVPTTSSGPAQGASPEVAVEGASVLDDLLARLSAIDDVPLDERPALFEQANEVLVAALADLEEV